MTSEPCCIKCQSRNVDGVCLRCGGSLVYLESTAGWYPQDDGTEVYWDGDGWTGLKRPGSPLSVAVSPSEPTLSAPSSSDVAPDGTPWSTPQGWHPDPYNSAHVRFWDGSRWTQVALREKPHGVFKASKGAASWVVWLAVPALIAGGLWLVQNRQVEVPAALTNVPGVTTQGIPADCDGVSSDVIRISEDEYGSNSPLRFVDLQGATETASADDAYAAQARNAILAQWVVTGDLVYPTLQCDARGVLPDGTEVPIFVAVGSTAQSASDKVIAFAERGWLSPEEEAQQAREVASEAAVSMRQYDIENALRNTSNEMGFYKDAEGEYPASLDVLDLKFDPTASFTVTLRRGAGDGFCLEAVDKTSGEVLMHYDSEVLYSEPGSCPP